MEERYIRNHWDSNLTASFASKKIAIVGVGGFGGYTAEALVRIGFRDITLYDSDKFEESNLNRQNQCTEKTLGLNKVEVVSNHLKEIDSKANIRYHVKRLSYDNPDDIKELASYDIVLLLLDKVSQKRRLARRIRDSGTGAVCIIASGSKDLLRIIVVDSKECDLSGFTSWDNWEFIHPSVCFLTASLVSYKLYSYLNNDYTKYTEINLRDYR